ncbi:polysaccharide pyruvyl transferase family protein [uncultured Alistipes sp.]|uniref:polysaccharide pyruvyl transferase family protein n=1 Tax=uncultured Alistipes sp. TaxID=538949 RepID=UPI0026127DBF|nr:polysaccharide pyruvyl transferase family protein [uncultured Alistipes sp.]
MAEKIGIVTIFHIPNYGAMLQCYSLCSYLQGLGYQVILYHIPLSNIDRWAYKLKYHLKLRFMDRFIRQYMPPITRDLSEKSDIYMVGSDQVWNPDITGSMWDRFFLSFAPQDAKKVSYAASLGTSTWNHPELKSEANDLLRKFSAITVREDSGVELLKKEFGIDSINVLDPCFLPISWEKLTGPIIPNESVVLYKLTNSYRFEREVRSFAKENKCHFISVLSYNLPFIGSLRGLNGKMQSVESCLRNIAQAKYVITDSFHATVFSILFQRQFAVLPGVKGRQTRLTSLLQKLELEDRLVSSFDEAKRIVKIPIDYAKTGKIVASLQEQSLNILNNILKQ